MEMAKEPTFKAGRVDVDKKVEEMNEEEKEVFNLMENEEAKDEIDDDFILMLNGGVPAHDLAKQPKKGENDGIIVIDG